MNVEIARAESSRGELVLSERREEGAAPVLELRANGVFVMDSAETSTELALATAVLERVAEPCDVVIGGLGLGYTLEAVLADQRVARVSVVEIEEALIEWLRDGTVPRGRVLLADERVRVVNADLAMAVAEAREQYDVVLLDVDNGPGYLVHDSNGSLYEAPFLARVRDLLRPGGALAVWSAAGAPQLHRTLGEVFDTVDDLVLPVDLQRREEAFHVYLARALRGTRARSRGSVAPMSDVRIEHDSMGEVEVPADALWRAQTQRAVENFPISGQRLERRHVQALALVKAAAARANAELEVLTAEQADAIVAAARSVAAGEHDDHFPIDVFQTGSGTSSNMNTNEVLATLAAVAGVRVHPNDHVNASQSSNDTFPTSIHVAAALAVSDDLMPALDVLRESLAGKAEEFADLVKSGRTHLMDATPVTLGQEFGGYAATLELAAERLEAVLPRVRELPLGGTAVGTGINTPHGFAARAIAVLAEETGQPFTEARDHFEAQSTRDSLVELSGVLRTIAVGLTKICNDLRWMGSGPTAGLGEIRLPDLQPGSSIMPGKVNPVLPEATLQVCAQVVGNDAAVAWGGAAGNFELNVMLPMIARNLLESIRILSTSSRLLARRCVDGIEADAEQLRQYAESSPSIVTPLNHHVGYEAAAAIAKHALAEGITIRQAVVALGHLERGDLTEAELDAALDVDSMTGR